MHKAADRWAHAGAALFSTTELQERRRIWAACVVMDKYVSTYIGRPVAVHERDYDTERPSESEVCPAGFAPHALVPHASRLTK